MKIGSIANAGRPEMPGLPLSVLMLLWTILIAGFTGWDCYRSYTAEYANAVAVAIDNYNKDVMYRRWASMHGGVYAPVTPQTPPNPDLAHIPDRDITLPSGKILTLINPSYMTRQVHELTATQYGVRGHITSLKPLRGGNAPDSWEAEALRLFEKGKTEYFSLDDLGGKPFLRLMRPLTTESSCLKCHAHQGYKTGDIRGGLSVSVPWAPHRERFLAQIPAILAGHGSIWLLGTVGIVIFRRRLQTYLSEKDSIVEALRQSELALEESADRFRRMFEESSKNEAQIRLLLQTTDQGIYGTDENGCFTFVNRAGLQILGYRIEDLVGKDSHSQIHHSHADGSPYPADDCPVYRANAARTSCRADNEALWRKDGTCFDAEFSSYPVIENGRFCGAVITFSDITERKQTEEAIYKAIDLAQSANQAKRDFLATMSHEIRTPMNGVIGMTSVLLETELTSEQREYTEIVRKSGENLLSLINDILDFSKIEARKLDTELLDFDLHQLIEDAVELLSLRSSDKGLELICHIDPLLPAHLRGDPGRLRQVITNLVGNAIKFTRKGEVVVRASLVSDMDGYATVLFEVHDTGIGIPAERLGAVFAPFTQVDSSTTRTYGGTGLGLAICKQLAELMGGEIGVTSEQDKGSTFWFTARLEKQPTDVAKASAAPVRADIAGTKILVVDDNAAHRKLMATLLEQWGCRHETAIDGTEGLARLTEAAQAGEPFRIALLDQEMPGMDGMELGRRIKADPAVSSTLIVMVTSLKRRGDAAALELIGFSGCLPKPVRQAQLYDCLELAVGKGQSTHDRKQAPGIITQHTVAVYPLGACVLVAEDNIINQKVAQSLLSKLGYKADVVADGREAVRALELIDYDLVLMDCMMPEMDGYEATALIRSPDSKVLNHAVPVIAMTANAMQGDRDKCLLSGMNDYLSKPVKKSELAEVLERWIGTGAKKDYTNN